MSFPYLINDVVLARVPNGRIYYTKIRSISLARKECVTEFDDGSIATVDWTNIFDGRLREFGQEPANLVVFGVTLHFAKFVPTAQQNGIMNFKHPKCDI